MVSRDVMGFKATTPYLESPGSLERERWNLVTTSIANVDSKHVLSTIIQDFDHRNSVFLQSRVRELVDGVVGPVSSIIDCSRDVLDVVVDLFLFGRA
jgi:hypothetical protein